MTKQASFLWRLLGLTLILLTAFSISILLSRNSHYFVSMLSATAISLLSIGAGYYVNRWAWGKPHKTFMRTVIGGMILRVFLVAILLILIVTHTRIPLVQFFIFLSISYLAYQLYEVYYINRQLRSKQF